MATSTPDLFSAVSNANAAAAVAQGKPVAVPSRAVKKKEQDRTNVQEATVLLNVRFRRPGNRRQGSLANVETDADKVMLHLSKELLDSEELKDLQREDNDLRRWLYKIAFPSQFRKGVYLLPIGLIQRVEDRLEEYIPQRKDLVEAFLATYDQRVEEAKERLKSQFDPSDYPSAGAIRQAFGLEWYYLAFATPDQLKGIKSDLFKREAAKAAERMEQATDEITAVMRASFKELVDHMVDRLTPDEDGKKRTFKESTIKNFREFLELFPLKNVTNDEELASLVEKASSLTSGVDAAELRSSDALRGSIQKGLAQMKGKLDKMVIDKPRRAFAFEEED